MLFRDDTSTPTTTLRALDYRSGRVREVRFRGQWRLRPASDAALFANGVRYGIAVDDDGWLVVCRFGAEGGVRPSVRFYVDAGCARDDGVPAAALEHAFPVSAGAG